MSLAFSDATNYKGLVQMYEKLIGANRGDVSGNTNKLKDFTADVNVTFDDFVQIAIQSAGTWQWDDSNQTDYPIITTNLVANQRDYSFTTDGSNNLILDIFKVLISNGTTYTEIKPVDVQSQSDTTGFTNGSNSTGTPSRYDKTANGIFLDPIPASNVTNGLKVYINREPSYFAYNDTTRKPGVPGLFHSYFYKKPAYMYASRNNMPLAGGRLRNGSFTGLLYEVNSLEDAIKDYYSSRTRDQRQGFTLSTDSNK